MANFRAAKSGLSRDLQKKIEAKYDPELASECLQWIQGMVNPTGCIDEDALDFSTSGDQQNFSSVLHDGVILARMVNALDPGAISTHKYRQPPKLAFKQMELIELFINKTKELGVPDHECFQTVDLYEDQSLHQVVTCIQSLGRKSKARGLKGFGPKESETNRREFTEAQILAGKCVIGLQMGSNQGASQAGMTFGKQRMIID